MYVCAYVIRFLNLGEMMNLGGLDGSVTTLGGRVKLTGKAAGLARRAVYAVSDDGWVGGDETFPHHPQQQ